MYTDFRAGSADILPLRVCALCKHTSIRDSVRKRMQHRDSKATEIRCTHKYTCIYSATVILCHTWAHFGGHLQCTVIPDWTSIDWHFSKLPCQLESLSPPPRLSSPGHGFMILNRLSSDNMHDLLSPDLEFRVQKSFVLFKRSSGTCIYHTCMIGVEQVYVIMAVG